ncbi:MAG TPA: acyl-CoA dehydrogenase family protein [Mycobacteriales bacterium]|nr:acyl-CoA dehydrogenase family protein [Mycobacteriales bacterium]
MSATHEVTNQPPPLTGYDAYGTDPALVEAVHRHGGDFAGSELAALGRLAGSEWAREWAVQADTHPPVLRTHDRYGHRIDEVEFHPAWHELMWVAVGHGLHGPAWVDPEPAPHLRRAAATYLWYQVEAGHVCPISMTYAVVPALRHSPDLAARYEPGLTSTSYDFGLRPPESKSGLIAGMGMTEKQGGSDVRANTTRAVLAADGTARLTGHKWFLSAPMSDLFLVLAQAPAGLSCFCVPRVLPDGSRNAIRLQRLKDKLGNRSNASAEVEFDGAVGWPVGPAGRGVPTIIEMVTMTRLDCVIGSAATMRQATAQAIHHATFRAAFGGPLRDTPLMRAVLADLAVETEAATALALRLAAAVDASEDALSRLGTAVGKFWVCKRTPTVVAEALECLGGNGYVEDSGLPRLYREAPLNSLWEGAGNVIALDVLRAMARQPESVSAFLAEVDSAAGADVRLDRAAARLRDELSDAGSGPGRARRVAASMALVLQGSLLVRYAPGPVADAFCASRLGGDWGHVLGTLGPAADIGAIVDRAAPE